MILSNFKFQQILEINRRSGELSTKDDLYFCMCRHIVNNQHEKSTTGFNLRDARLALNNDLNDEQNIEKLLTDLVTEGYLEVKSKKYFIK